jgi:hypothetical protein
VGICNAASAMCECFEGYAGHECEQCASGYQLSGHGTCDKVADPCESNADACESGCSGNGACADGSCDCVPGAFGRQCAVRGCPPEWSMEDCGCCTSGVLSRHGTCCEAEVPGMQPVLDSAGECCGAGHVDACGARSWVPQMVLFAVWPTRCNTLRLILTLLQSTLGNSVACSQAYAAGAASQLIATASAARAVLCWTARIRAASPATLTSAVRHAAHAQP